MTPLVECAKCRQPLPAGEPVAFVDKQRLIHLKCYQPPPPSPMHQLPEGWSKPPGRRKLQTVPAPASP
jgi:hypothetical protein